MEKVPIEINKILDTYFKIIDLELPDLLEAYYLYGSVSLGAFKDSLSDIDFVAVINRDLAERDVNILKKIHKDMQRKYPRTTLDGFYIKKKDMESLNKMKNSCLRFNDGTFVGFTEFDKNSIDAYQLKEYGIPIKGQKIEDTCYMVDWDILNNSMRNNLNTYWHSWWKGCKRFPSLKSIGLLFSLSMVEWGVLGVSRLYFTFKEKDIISKAGAGEYALKAVPKRWHKIIKESMRLRNGSKKPLYKSVFERRKDALNYMEFMIKECNRLFNRLF